MKRLYGVTTAMITPFDEKGRLDADKAAQDLGSAKVLNVVLLGAAIRSGELGLSEEDMEKAVREKVPERFLELNRKALAWSRE